MAISESPLPYFSPTALLLIGVVGIQWLHMPLLSVWVGYVLLPVLDLCLPLDEVNPDKDQEKRLGAQSRWRLPLFVYTVVDLCTVVWFLEYMSQAQLSPFAFLAVLYTVGNFSTGGINVAHECMHKQDFWSRSAAYLELGKCLYTHFAIEHVRGHHIQVATPLDPATAKFGQSLYAFLPQSVVGGWKHAWLLEKERLNRQRRSEWSMDNVFIKGKILEAAIVLGILCRYGLFGLFVFVIQSVVGVGLLEAVNYIEHYGLVRRKEGEDYESVAPQHSWNAPFVVTNWLFFKLQRHSDHHAQGSKPYQLLQSWKEVPTLPGSYPLCVVVATIPPLWFSLMHPLLDNAKGSVERFRVWLGLSLALQTGLFTIWFALAL
jgi:alkane 1-monooxygenase